MQVQIVASDAEQPDSIVRDLCLPLAAVNPSIFLYFAGSRHALSVLAPAITAALPSAVCVGCSTCGEIGPAGCVTGTVTGFSLPACCGVAVEMIPNFPAFRFEHGEQLVRRLCTKLGRSVQHVLAHAEEYVFVTLTDGLSGMAEILVTSLSTYAPNLALVGGSAADDFRFRETWVAVQEQALTSAAAVILLRPGIPFSPFYLHHYQPTSRSVVVTQADAEHRKIDRMDGRPASDVWCELVGQPLPTDPEQLAKVVSENPIVFGFPVAGNIHLRSVMGIQQSSLLMAGATEEGAVLQVMKADDMVQKTKLGLQAALKRVPNPESLLLFNCGGRMWEANVMNITNELAEAMCPVPAVGFTTYGEQFGPLQVNHTLTGLVWGRENDKD
jgi:hypothetical protein